MLTLWCVNILSKAYHCLFRTRNLSCKIKKALETSADLTKECNVINIDAVISNVIIA